MVIVITAYRAQPGTNEGNPFSELKNTIEVSTKCLKDAGMEFFLQVSLEKHHAQITRIFLLESVVSIHFSLFF